MDPCEPHLLDDLFDPRLGITTPDRWLKRPTLLVDCQRMVCVLDTRAEFGVMKAISLLAETAVGYAERANRVPYANATDDDFLPGNSIRKVRQKALFVPPPLLEWQAVIVPQRIEIVHVPFAHDANVTHHSGSASRGVSTARKAKQENLVSVLIIIDEESVGAAHICGKTEACTAADQVIDKIPGTDPRVIVDDLRDSVGTAGLYDASQTNDVGGAAVAVGLVPGSIAASDKPAS